MSTLSLWTRRDPFAEFDRFFDVDRFFATPIRSASFTPAAEVVRDGDDALVRLEVPGLDAEKDVTVEVDRGRLMIRGERRDERSEEKSGRMLREVRYGSFARSFALPAHVTADAVTASYDAGILTIRVAGAYAAPSTATRIAVTTGERPAVEAAKEETPAAA
ncbi:Molecular chaperone IbpA, HSP20 family [Pseudonocardia thermophila]|jgi:Molecular chaperone (small heat shock protein)|uniref:Molecular chaperone IbpA, HSP20 family n=1 Tax=Pseudonocardia thermophila TaxID=1848 RepID=A0A1M7A4U7_PSETH|nr:Hsp20/alpha crystallin family protein [Pseudonocardia thermophila]SHL37774.1 Molecular chaperone IbpA, HSP20 family [Pseudonocardia thermophila]